MTVFSKESFHSVKDEIKPLVEKHWNELASYKDIPLNINYKMYAVSDAIEELEIYTVRESGDLIGYAIFFVRQPLHYLGSMWAIADVIWLHPDFRRNSVGRGFVKFCEDRLKIRGVQVITYGMKLSHPALGRLLESEGYTPVEVHHQKKVK